MARLLTPRSRARDIAWLVAALAVALVLSAFIVWIHVGGPRSWATVAVLVALGILSKSIRIKQAESTTYISFSGIVQAAAIVVAGPIASMLVGSLSTIGSVRRKQLAIQRIFNTVMSGLVSVLGGIAYLALGGVIEPQNGRTATGILVHVLAPLFAANIIMLTLNAFLVATVIRIAEGMPIRHSFATSVRGGWIPYLGYGIVAFLFADLWTVEGLGPVSVILVVAPLALAQWSMSQQAAEQRTHYRTVETVVAAVEARHPNTRGVSQAVASVSGAVGDELRLRAGQAESLQFAAILHDVGLIAPMVSRHRIDGRLGDSDIAQYLTHPDRGVSMLEGIEFLEGSTAAIRHHHERWDGTGYPNGLEGEEIPLLARIVAVSATYVALLRRTGDPAWALDSIKARAGSQLDPGCVVALDQAISRGRLDHLKTLAMLPDLDHDDPATSDLLAGVRTSVRR
ncbi:HD-GYP domain-containing protein [Luteipulveratus halotolerans]|uniref:HD-GYP domain-containing protein n=1 Tax=Luteipulveratus halotolerans TaxID=1631356 RepID=UPI0012FCEFA1|nr:HD domain-containing phosphohydrolase [Luteipulveratus halotolerans]